MLRVLIVKGMSVVVNVMLSLMSVMSPPPALCNLSVRTDVKLCIFGVSGFRGELGFLNCDDVCMCVLNKQFELLEFVSESKSGPHCWGRGGSTQFAQQLEFAVTAPPLVGCVVWSQMLTFYIIKSQESQKH